MTQEPAIITLERIKQGISQYLSSSQLETLEVSSQEDYLIGGFRAELRWHTAGLSKKRVVSHPTTWWDAFKERWFPQWAKDRWPPQYTTYNAMKLFPNVPLPKDWLRGEYAIFERSYD